MRIALISDTHIPTNLDQLSDELLSKIDGVDAILHAGDIVSNNVLKTLAAIAPTTAVAGNMDPPEIADKLSDRELIRLGGRTIGLKHGHQPHEVQSHYIDRPYDSPEMELFFQLMASQLPDAEIIVFGHFHRPVITHWNGILFINPGAVAPSHGKSSFALLELGETVSARIIPLGKQQTN
ncbi:YfcE family phosphodiesterase [Candidatus Bipolaricaulota bacterium]|nr:YfcE family phosphodiesterase [Candidatus Bipolaricaulota bacterium]